MLSSITSPSCIDRGVFGLLFLNYPVCFSRVFSSICSPPPSIALTSAPRRHLPTSLVSNGRCFQRFFLQPVLLPALPASWTHLFPMLWLTSSLLSHSRRWRWRDQKALHTVLGTFLPPRIIPLYLSACFNCVWDSALPLRFTGAHRSSAASLVRDHTPLICCFSIPEVLF